MGCKITTLFEEDGKKIVEIEIKTKKSIDEVYKAFKTFRDST